MDTPEWGEREAAARSAGVHIQFLTKLGRGRGYCHPGSRVFSGVLSVLMSGGSANEASLEVAYSGKYHTRMHSCVSLDLWRSPPLSFPAAVAL